MGADSPELLALENLFKGELESSLHCSKCPYTSSRSEEFTYALHSSLRQLEHHFMKCHQFDLLLFALFVSALQVAVDM